MISGGAAFTFSMLSFLAGYVVATLVEGGRRARRPPYRAEGRRLTAAARMAIHRPATLDDAAEAVTRAARGADTPQERP